MSPLLKNLGALLSGNIVAQLISLGFLPLLGRVYGPTAFGYFAIFVACTALLSVVATLRYELAIVLPPEDIDAVHMRRASSKVLLIATCIITLVSIGVFAYVLVVAKQQMWMIIFIGITVFLISEATIRYYWFARQKRFGLQSTGRMIQAAVTGGFQLILGLFLLPTAEGLVLGYFIGQLVVLLYLWARDDLRRQPAEKNSLQERLLLSRYKRMPLVNGPNALIDAIRVNGINFIIAAVSSPSALGQFSMAWRVAQAPVGLIGGAVSQVFFPRLASARSGELTSIVKKAVIATAAVSVPIFVVLAAVSPWLTPWFLGSEWHEAGQYIRALTPWLCLNVVTSPVSTVFIVTERQGTLLGFAAVYMIVPLFLLWILGNDLLVAVWWMSVAMAILLLGFIFLAILVATQHDRKTHLL